MNVFIKEPQNPAQACIIWMHGLGADASDMMNLAEQLPTEGIALRHVFLNAPLRPVTVNGGMVMPAWYDIIGVTLVDREDQQGIEESELLIRNIMEEQLKEGFSLNQIFLAGFSQGGAMALHTALHTPGCLAGVIVLSGYLPLALKSRATLDKGIPFFMGLGEFDPLVLPQWTKKSKEWLLNEGYKKITCFSYPMEHSICSEEIKDLSFWLKHQISGEA